MTRTAPIDLNRLGGEREPPCIWVLAGVLSYRLCDRFYECEGCELFHALAGGGARGTGRGTDRPESGSTRWALRGDEPAGSASPTEEQVTAHLCHVLRDCQLFLDRYYRPPHFWLREEREGEVQVGVAGHLLRILRPIDEIVTPGVGLHLSCGQPCGWIAHDGIVVSLSMPISGIVSAVSDATDVAGSARPSGEDSWLFRVTAGERLCEVEGLLRGEETLLWYLDTIRTLKRCLRGALSSSAPEGLGAVMADGGEPQPCLHDVLGRARFEALLNELA